jgi:hypothetical protein
MIGSVERNLDTLGTKMFKRNQLPQFQVNSFDNYLEDKEIAMQQVQILGYNFNDKITKEKVDQFYMALLAQYGGKLETTTW